MRLHLRLTLVILAVVGVMGVVSLVSFRLNRGIERLVADLDQTSTAPLDRRRLLGETFEMEGSWRDAGHFEASEIERLPRSRRPKVRGVVQAYDGAAQILVLYGRRIRVTTETELDFDVGSRGEIERLSPGARAEVSCKVEADGTWSAREVATHDVKESDKVKGTVTDVGSQTESGQSLSIEGLAIRVPPGVEISYPSGPVHRIEIATQMALSIEEAVAAGQELLNHRHREKELRARNDPRGAAEADGAVEDAAERLVDAAGSFAHYIAECRGAVDEEVRASTRSGRLDRAQRVRTRAERWLVPLQEASETFQTHAARLVELAGPSPDEAQAFFRQTVEPSLRGDVAPSVRAYLLETEAELGEALADIGVRASDAARLAILTNVAGIALAIAAGLLVSRSISRPVRALAAAASRVGAGDLATRVGVRTGGELGELADAFDRMAGALSATTVSVARLHNVIDSMAGAFVLLDREGCIVSVNDAAAELLGYRREELTGRPFSEVCPSVGSASGAARTNGAGEEREFRRKDGTTLPVSFSSATLRGEGSEGGACVCLALDLSDRKRMEERLRRSLAEKDLLLRELHHRVKSNLQVISSLLDLQSRSIHDAPSLASFQESQDRIRSMVFIHDQLLRTEELEQIDLGAYLELLVAHLAQAHVDPPGRVLVRTELEPLRLDLDRALACGLIVNELVTNALKHAFAPDSPGEVVVCTRMLADDRVALEVRDNGRGVSGTRPANSTSLGLSLVDTLVRQLRGELVLDESGGAAFRVEFPCGAVQEVA